MGPQERVNRDRSTVTSSTKAQPARASSYALVRRLFRNHIRRHLWPIVASILAMGEQPRMPRRGGEEIIPQDVLVELPAESNAFQESVRQARQRSGLDSSLAEVLVGAIGPDEIRRRRQRGPGPRRRDQRD